MTKDTGSHASALARRHELFGWRALLVFLTLGIALEALHGLKVGWYLDVSNEARRFMWTLSHAHGTLVALVNLAFAFSLPRLSGASARELRVASRAFLIAAILLPAGFFLGGLVTHAGDPGLGVLLVPVGALALLVGVAQTARLVARH